MCNGEIMGNSRKIIPRDMPKLMSPFMRKEINGEYIVTPEIEKGFEWVFEDPTVLAIEKINGTNVSVIVEEGQITSIWNRTERLPFFNKGKQHIIMGVMESYARGYCELPDGQWWGELVGEKVNGNPYKIKGHLWIPFKTYAVEHLAYTSWGRYPKTYESIRTWFQDLMPLFSQRMHHSREKNIPGTSIPHFCEGVVFTHPDGRLAKLRLDMFDFYKGRRHKETDI